MLVNSSQLMSLYDFRGFNTLKTLHSLPVGGGEVRQEACRWGGALALGETLWLPWLHVSQWSHVSMWRGLPCPQPGCLPETQAPEAAPPYVCSEPGCLKSFLWNRSNTSPRGNILQQLLSHMLYIQYVSYVGNWNILVCVIGIRERPEVTKKAGASFLLSFWGTQP